MIEILYHGEINDRLNSKGGFFNVKHFSYGKIYVREYNYDFSDHQTRHSFSFFLLRNFFFFLCFFGLVSSGG